MHVTATDVIIGAIERSSSVLCSFCRNITIDRIDIDTERLSQRGSEPLDLSQRLTVDTINNIRHNIERLRKEAEAMHTQALEQDENVLGMKEPLGYDHQPSYPALLESAKSCELCRLISEVAERDGIFPEFDPKFDMKPDQIARKNASQRLKLSAFQPRMSDACHQDFNGGLGSDKGKGVLISG